MATNITGVKMSLQKLISGSFHVFKIYNDFQKYNFEIFLMQFMPTWILQLVGITFNVR
jgi:hypothetical protein